MQQGGLATQLAQSIQGGSPMNIATPGSPTAMPGLQAPSPTPMPDRSPATNFTPNQMQQPVPQGMPQPQQAQQPMITLPVQDASPEQPGTQIPVSESELLIKALDSRLKSLSKIHMIHAQSQAGIQPEHTIQTASA